MVLAILNRLRARSLPGRADFLPVKYHGQDTDCEKNAIHTVSADVVDDVTTS